MQSNTKITLIGAGLVGSLLSIFLSRKGFEVEIFERRPDLRVGLKDNKAGTESKSIGTNQDVSTGSSRKRGRSINLAISTRGLYALSELELEKEVLAQAIPMKGRMIHAQNGELTFQRYGRDDTECIYSISREWLNSFLMSEAEKNKVKIHFNKKISASDFEKSSQSLPPSTNTIKTVIGTDGSSSALRAAFLKFPQFQSSEKELDYGYKELVIPPQAQLHQPLGNRQLEKNALHIWPRGNFMFIALPNLDGSFTGTLFLPFQGPLSFETLKTALDVESFFQEQFPDAISLWAAPSHLSEEFQSNPTGHMVTVKCFPWSFQNPSGSQTLLMGDAAHAIVPFFGQGMNCGFEDCTVLNQMLHLDSDLKSCFEKFSRQRKPDTDAIADLALENFIEMRDKVGNPKFILEKKVEALLQKKFPQEYISRYAQVTFSRVPYTKALSAGLIQNEILSELCKGIKNEDETDLNLAEKLIREKITSL